MKRSSKERELLADFESRLTKADREGIRQGIEQGIKDIQDGRYEEYDHNGLRNLATKLVAASAKRDPLPKKHE
ncbi:MAG TPA: hypothetical protein VG759_17900 [Candidatus Angelobacter sp.]|jgi:hypothetical protein|nr:hypothetical protein [Candidatus Angelobacter sp.]